MNEAVKYMMNRWISAFGVFCLGIAACIWAVSQWRVQALRSEQWNQDHSLRVQEHQLREHELEEKLAQQSHAEEQREEQRIEAIQEEFRAQCQKEAEDWGQITTEIALKVGGDWATNPNTNPRAQAEQAYHECLQRVGLEN